MKVFPFEVGYASAMSDNEMLHLSAELECSGWKQEQQAIREMVDEFMKNSFRQGSSPDWPHWPARFYWPLSQPSISGEYTKVGPSYRTIQVRVPDVVDPEVARMLAEMQIREQMHGEYDPRYPNDD